MKKSDLPVIVEETFNSPPEVVWKAITDMDEMRYWFFENIPDFSPKAGFETTFDVKSGDRIFPHRWKITEVIPTKKIGYHWTYDGYSGESDVTFELIPKKQATLLKVTHRVVKDFPQDIPEFQRESCIGGWRYFIQDRLKKYIEAK